MIWSASLESLDWRTDLAESPSSSSEDLDDLDDEWLPKEDCEEDEVLVEEDEDAASRALKFEVFPPI